MLPKLVIIAPCYNEQEVLEDSFKKLDELIHKMINEGQIEENSSICLIDDGSFDNTWQLIQQIENENKNVIGIKLSNNFGHQYALLAGMESLANEFDIYITIDVDLQDDINIITDMIKKIHSGFEVIYGVRKKRDSDSFFKENTAKLFYKLMKFLGVDLVYNHADYRAFTNKFLLNFLEYKESNLFLRGIFPDIGFKSATIEYERTKRKYGESKYPLKKMLYFAWDGITSFSVKPIQFVLILGIISFIFSMLVFAYIIFVNLQGKEIQGWTSLIAVVVFFGSIQMISIGIIGEYIGKIYKEVKRRPRYIVDEIVSNKNIKGN
jgi:glycosyltransferase involved in cell wall biosynthesis